MCCESESYLMAETEKESLFPDCDTTWFTVNINRDTHHESQLCVIHGRVSVCDLSLFLSYLLSLIFSVIVIVVIVVIVVIAIRAIRAIRVQP